ncbi:MAG: hypothetical protein PSU93_09635 [Methylobacter sp.]|uniref:Uncharacterized protein n=1 Tax=Candidatus Methylobacter titanis TaxID=3053457 RepID=A0AA43TLR0_9GAMM|nr:hypothetical protein [Candidatus Methylobacter titanis]
MDIPLCTETTTAKDRIIIKEAMAEPIIHIMIVMIVMIVMINTIPSPTGAVITRIVSNNAIEVMAAIIVTITSTVETMINDLPINAFV